MLTSQQTAAMRGYSSKGVTLEFPRVGGVAIWSPGGGGPKGGTKFTMRVPVWGSADEEGAFSGWRKFYASAQA